MLFAINTACITEQYKTLEVMFLTFARLEGGFFMLSTGTRFKLASNKL